MEERCCKNNLFDEQEAITFQTSKKSLKIMDLLKAIANVNQAKYRYSFSKQSQVLEEFLGLSSDHLCEWNIALDEKDLSDGTAFTFREFSGKTVTIRYEAVQEEGSGSGGELLEVTSSLRPRSMRRTRGRKSRSNQ